MEEGGGTPDDIERFGYIVELMQKYPSFAQTVRLLAANGKPTKWSINKVWCMNLVVQMLFSIRTRPDLLF